MKTYINLEDLLVRLEAENEYYELVHELTAIGTLKRVKEIIGECESIIVRDGTENLLDNIITYIHTDERVE